MKKASHHKLGMQGAIAIWSDRLALDLGYRRLARLHDVSVTTVSRILRGRLYQGSRPGPGEVVAILKKRVASIMDHYAVVRMAA